jgi:methionyl aminopeptidase
MIHVRTPEEIAIIRENALMVSATLTEVAKMLKPGVTTQELDTMAETFIRDHGGTPSFKGYGPRHSPYPASLCISVNDVVVHGLPGSYVVKEGDVVAVDCGFNRNGYHGDHAYTFAVGEVPDAALKLLRVTKDALERGIAAAKENNRVGDISFAIEDYTHRKFGYGVVRELVGHGVGKKLHEEPNVPNYGRRGDGKKLKEGYVLAIEPMINLGTREVYTEDDQWTIRTQDGQVSAHFEHTTLVRKSSGEALSSFAPIQEAERANPNLNDRQWTDAFSGN